MRFVRLFFNTLIVGIAMQLMSGADQNIRLGTNTEAPPQRLALLIGNSKYQTTPTWPSLTNSHNDVDALAAKLKLLGFQTQTGYDLNRAEFIQAVSDFELKILPGDIALFYYSGHGIQHEGVNYLIPTDMPSNVTKATILGYGVELSVIRTSLNIAKLSFIILDACRSNVNLISKGPLQGFASYTSRGALIAYAADEGQAALENPTEKLSLFTKHLLNALDRQNVALCPLFSQVREAVDVASNHVQFPFVYDGVIGEFFFNKTTTTEAQKLRFSPLDSNQTWSAIETSANPNDFAAYIFKFPGRVFTDSAERRLTSLMSSTAKALGIVPLLRGAAMPEAVAVSNQGQRLFDEGAYAEAFKNYGRLLVLQPSDPVVQYDYATCLLHLNRLNEAIDYYTRAIAIDKTFPWAYHNRGVAHQLKNETHAAIDDYSKTLELRPGVSVAYNNRALAMRQQDAAAAAADAKKAIVLNPSYAPSRFNFADILSILGEKEESARQRTAGLELTLPKTSGIGAMVTANQ